jgi:hypothetical protein
MRRSRLAAYQARWRAALLALHSAQRQPWWRYAHTVPCWMVVSVLMVSSSPVPTGTGRV